MSSKLINYIFYIYLLGVNISLFVFSLILINKNIIPGDLEVRIINYTKWIGLFSLFLIINLIFLLIKRKNTIFTPSKIDFISFVWFNIWLIIGIKGIYVDRSDYLVISFLAKRIDEPTNFIYSNYLLAMKYHIYILVISLISIYFMFIKRMIIVNKEMDE